MKLIDKRGKLFGIANVVDIIVILLVIVIGAGTVYKFKFMDKTSKDVAMQPITYVVKVEKIRDYVYNNVKEGDELYDVTSGNPIGKITKIESEPATDYINMPDGTFKKVNVENRINAYFTVEAEGVVSDSGHFVNKTFELLVGSHKKIMTKYFECEGTIDSIVK
ncbi:MAG: DUF4330 domain-containing protein [Clostridia bacterium]|jgi:hypothetical protein|nr:DUF4330 domain-containing protein [Clostridia bacterium]MCI2001042.1 DUF4330 domain-containing protein [Clostridia bacterium]MCI2015641.1 DUF4330 domain-containing protein [Clostridia bacterium]